MVAGKNHSCVYLFKVGSRELSTRYKYGYKYRKYGPGKIWTRFFMHREQLSRNKWAGEEGALKRFDVDFTHFGAFGADEKPPLTSLKSQRRKFN
jgi:hypothetical protein